VNKQKLVLKKAKGQHNPMIKKDKKRLSKNPHPIQNNKFISFFFL